MILLCAAGFCLLLFSLGFLWRDLDMRLARGFLPCHLSHALVLLLMVHNNYLECYFPFLWSGRVPAALG